MLKNFKSGMYAWGGPGTVRLLKTKYAQPKIDEASFLSLYDEDRLARAQKMFNLSDVWVTFSWGFADQTEAEDYAFIQQRLDTFQKLGLRTHAYVQGLNVVTDDFPEADFFCRDVFGRKSPYSRGRSLICPQHPATLALIRKRIRLAAQLGFDGVFVDNIIFGWPPSFMRSDYAPFFGCHCQRCQTAFQKRFHYPLPSRFNSALKIKEYVQFRTEVMTTFIKKLSQTAGRSKVHFGINLFDPYQTNPEMYQGYNLKQISPYLDYYFIENHALPSQRRSNVHLKKLIEKGDKPVVVISYYRGIGFEPVFSQTDYQSIKAEAADLGYKPCYKVSEFTTRRIWHTLDFESLNDLKCSRLTSSVTPPPLKKLRKKTVFDRLLVEVSNYATIPLAALYFETSLLNLWGDWLYKKQLYAWRNFEMRNL